MTATMTRDGVLRQFYQDQEPLTAAAALSVTYAMVTQAARVRLGAEPYWSFISQDERDKAAASGAAMPDGSYPITACEGDNSVDTAIHAVGRGGADHDGIRKHIIKRANSLDCASKIPDNWNSDGSLKGDDAATAEAVTAAGAPPPPPPPPAKAAPPTDKAPAPTDKPADGEGSPEDAKVDAGMEVLVTNLLADIDALEKQQAKDPGNGEGADAQVQAHIDQLKAIAGQLQKSQAADSAEGPKGAPTPDKPAVPTGKPGEDNPAVAPDPESPLAARALASETPGNAEGVPNDGDDNGPGPGDIEATEICQNPDCGHTGGVHADSQELGGNSGACTTPGCACPGMIPEGDQVNGTADSGDGANDGQSNAGTDGGPMGGLPGKDDSAASSTAFAPGDVPDPTAAPPAAPAKAPQAPPVEGAPAAELPPLNPEPSVTVGPAFTMPVAWLEGSPTGDGRMIDAPGPDNAGLTWRTPPLALMGLKTSVHDPSGMSGNDPAVLIGRIENIERDGNAGKATGHLLMTEDGMEFATILEQMGRMGCSIDVGSAQVQITADPTIEPTGDVFDLPVMEHLVEGEIMGITVCPFAAFAGAYIVLGDGTDAPEAELPKAPEGMSMAINFVGEEACVPCAADVDGEPALVASAAVAERASLLHPPREWFESPGFTAGDERLRETFDPKTGRLSGKFACPMTVTEDGRVFGHVAQWGVCHQSPAFLNGGQCIMAPRSRIDYAGFHGTGDVVTAEGELLGVGRMTADTGHAPQIKGFGFAQAVAHYDNSGLTAAVVRAGEDEFGIWVAGSLHPSASEEQVFTMRANPPSGDWRPFGAGKELANVLFVNQPGFPMVKATQDMTTGRITSLVAAGVPMFTLPTPEPVVLTIEERLAALEGATPAVYEMATEHLRAKRATLV